MDFLKTYGLWIVVGIAVIVLMVVQFVYVGGMREEAEKKNAEVKKACEDVIRISRRINNGDYPSKGDMVEGARHLEKIRKERLAVEAKWRTHTEGLNRFMSNETRKGGEVTDPETIKKDPKTGDFVGKPIKWELFASRIRDLYNSVFKKMESKLQRKMEERLQVTLADEKYATSEVMLMDDAKAAAKSAAPKLAMIQSRILLQPDKLILVPVDQPFGADAPEEGWKEWRKYLITRDILERAVANTEVEIDRTLSAYVMASGKVVDDEGRKKRAKAIEEGESANLPKLKTVAWKRPSWRYIEQVVSITIDGPEVGNAELPGKGWIEDLSKSKKHKKAGRRSSWRRKKSRTKTSNSAKSEDKNPLEPQQPPEGEDAVYYDVFTLAIELKAHPKAIMAFHRELLKAKDIWYAPLGAEYLRLPDSEVMAAAGSREGKSTPATGEGVIEVIPDVAPLQSVASFDHEPPVTAILKYKVYRFRYSDVDNSRVASTTTTTPADKRRGRRYGPGRGMPMDMPPDAMPPNFR